MFEETNGKRYVKFVLIVLVLAGLTYFFTALIVFNGPGFSIKYDRFTRVSHNQIGKYSLDDAGEVSFERRNYQLQLTYIHDVESADPIDITNDLISHLERSGSILHQSETLEEKYNGYIFYTTKLTFQSGSEEAYVIYSIHYDEENKSLYYLICSSTIRTPEDIIWKYLDTFTIK
jgi:hypothetical protein